ncbi:hypothetical protein AB0L74_26015 [Streptomyces sp. NPDC052020]|uniref:hypothetical protein n=1 Tax=Streptomyces sp. NPDC052020 TaxID=3155677 RepID=UPI00343971CE
MTGPPARPVAPRASAAGGSGARARGSGPLAPAELTPYVAPLPVPPVLRPASDDVLRATEIALRPAWVRLHPQHVPGPGHTAGLVRGDVPLAFGTTRVDSAAIWPRPSPAPVRAPRPD